MAATKYTYSISTDFPNHKVGTDRLLQEINFSAIITAVDYINTSGDDCDVWFKAALSSGDKTILDGLVAVHSGEHLPGTFPVELFDGDNHPLLVQQDGSYYRLGQFSKVQNSEGTTVNPATQETLALIKDTDGIKKITDPLPFAIDNYNLLGGILKELQRMRVLMEHLTDEKVHEHDLETRD